MTRWRGKILELFAVPPPAAILAQLLCLSTTVVTPAGVIKFQQVSSAAGIISARFRACQKTEKLSTLVLVMDWTTELTSRVNAPRGLVDLYAWRVVVGADGDDEDDWWRCDADE